MEDGDETLSRGPGQEKGHSVGLINKQVLVSRWFRVVTCDPNM